MNVEYTGRQTTITPQHKRQVEEGISRIAKISGDSGSVHVILTADKYRQIAEVTLKAKVYDFVATAEGNAMDVALHDALQKLEQQAIKHKQRITTIKHHPKGDVKTVATESRTGRHLDVRPQTRRRRVRRLQVEGARMPPCRALASQRRRARSEVREAGGELVILTGMSGSGKLSALKAFEDLGYYAVDNLPLELIPQFAELVRGRRRLSVRRW